jgi:hypothetical protein
MRLIPKSRHHERAKAPRISISQAEITADLLYPANRRRVRADSTLSRHGTGR